MSDANSTAAGPAFSPVQAAFDAMLQAPTQEARDTAWTNLSVVASGGQYGPPATIYRDLNTRAISQLTEGRGFRDSALTAIERTALAIEAAAPQPAEQDPNAPPEGFEPPASIAEYGLPDNMVQHIGDEKGLEDVRQAAFEAKVPAPFFKQGLIEAQRRVHLLGDEAAFDKAVTDARAVVLRRYSDPAEAEATLAAGAGYLLQLVKQQPALGEAVSLMMASPWAIMTAANMARGRR